MITRWRYFPIAVMIARWHHYIDAVMITSWGQPSIDFPIGDHVNVSRCRSHTNASGVISTSHIVASHITKLQLSFRQILQFRFRDNPQGRIEPEGKYYTVPSWRYWLTPIRPLATAMVAPLHPALSLASRLMLLMVAPLA